MFCRLFFKLRLLMNPFVAFFGCILNLILASEWGFNIRKLDTNGLLQPCLATKLGVLNQTSRSLLPCKVNHKVYLA